MKHLTGARTVQSAPGAGLQGGDGFGMPLGSRG